MSGPSKPSVCRHGRPNARRSVSPVSMVTSEQRAGRPRRPAAGSVQAAAPPASPTPPSHRAGEAPHRGPPNSPHDSGPWGSCGGGAHWPRPASEARLQRAAFITAWPPEHHWSGLFAPTPQQIVLYKNKYASYHETIFKNPPLTGLYPYMIIMKAMLVILWYGVMRTAPESFHCQHAIRTVPNSGTKWRP